MTGRRPALCLALAAGMVLAAPAAGKPLRIGFYLPWDAASRAAIVQQAAGLDVIAPMSGALDSAAGTVRWQDDPARGPALSKGKPKVFPIVSNAHDEVWDTVAADGVLTDDRAAQAFIAALSSQAKAQDYAGYILDFENLSPTGATAYAPFLAKLRQALKPQGRALWVTATLAADPALVHALESATDGVVLMAYDQCWANSTPGPIAGQDWLERTLDAKLAGVDPSHYLVALGAYGYDWPQGRPAAVISAPEALRRAKAAGQAVTREAPAANPHFSYPGPDGRPHAVWYLDAAAFQAQRAAVEARHVRGVAVWRLGLEDPAIWARPGKAPAMTVAPPPPPCVTLPTVAR
jgi:spore germination protein YaaH